MVVVQVVLQHELSLGLLLQMERISMGIVIISHSRVMDDVRMILLSIGPKDPILQQRAVLPLLLGILWV